MVGAVSSNSHVRLRNLRAVFTGILTAFHREYIGTIRIIEELYKV